MHFSNTELPRRRNRRARRANWLLCLAFLAFASDHGTAFVAAAHDHAPHAISQSAEGSVQGLVPATEATLQHEERSCAICLHRATHHRAKLVSPARGEEPGAGLLVTRTVPLPETRATSARFALLPSRAPPASA